ncbi:hypothetical protein FACS1894109_18170 [Spirochaetia bacterium]|nr:hypothetical protein FACS1894109_18170 [Spirochaetia bacterium]
MPGVFDYFNRVISFCPLNDFAVTPLAGMKLRFKSITGACQNIIETFGDTVEESGALEFSALGKQIHRHAKTLKSLQKLGHPGI